MNTSEILNGAADKIQRDGWWSSSQGSDGGTEPWCASNAIKRQSSTLTAEEVRPAREALAAYLGGSSVFDIFTWNDAPERTATDVIAALRAAAAIEQARETARGPLGDQKPIRVPLPSGGAR